MPGCAAETAGLRPATSPTASPKSSSGQLLAGFAGLRPWARSAGDYKTLLFDLKGGVTKITLNRPDAANALNLDMARDLIAAALPCYPTYAEQVGTQVVGEPAP